MADWVKRYENEQSLDGKEALLKVRPDGEKAAARMWREIYRDLGKEWAMPYAAWLLRTSPSYATAPVRKAREGEQVVTPFLQIQEAISKSHLKSAEIGSCCVGFSLSREPEVIALLEKVMKGNPHEAVQGQAALALALIQRGLGQEPAIMKKRLANLREAILKSSDVRIGTTTVAEVARQELFEINHLIKGRVAPEIVGVSEMKREMALSSFRGEIVVLFFWSSRMHDAERVFTIMADFIEKRAGQKVRVVGVTDDPMIEVRKLRADGTTPWSSLVDPSGERVRSYQVRRMPYVYVLDEKGVIYYKGAPGAFVDFSVDALLARGKEAKRLSEKEKK